VKYGVHTERTEIMLMGKRNV